MAGAPAGPAAAPRARDRAPGVVGPARPSTRSIGRRRCCPGSSGAAWTSWVSTSPSCIPTYGLIPTALGDDQLRPALARAVNRATAEVFRGPRGPPGPGGRDPDVHARGGDRRAGARRRGARAAGGGDGRRHRPAAGDRGRTGRAVDRHPGPRQRPRLRPGLAAVPGARRRAHVPRRRLRVGEPDLDDELRLQPPRQLRRRRGGDLSFAPARRGDAPLPGPALRLPGGRCRVGRLAAPRRDRPPGEAGAGRRRPLRPGPPRPGGDRGALRRARRRRPSPSRLDRLGRRALHAALGPATSSDRDEFAASGLHLDRGRRGHLRPSGVPRLRGGRPSDPAGLRPAACSPGGRPLHAMFASDIGHWDVPDAAGVLPEAWEAVEDGRLTSRGLRRLHLRQRRPPLGAAASSPTPPWPPRPQPWT